MDLQKHVTCDFSNLEWWCTSISHCLKPAHIINGCNQPNRIKDGWKSIWLGGGPGVSARANETWARQICLVPRLSATLTRTHFLGKLEQHHRRAVFILHLLDTQRHRSAIWDSGIMLILLNKWCAVWHAKQLSSVERVQCKHGFKILFRVHTYLR